MTPADAAKNLDGREYGSEGTEGFWKMLDESGLVAVFGYSDDNMEFRGGINDEVGCYNGGFAYLTSAGMLTNACENEACPHFLHEKKRAAIIEAVWGDDGEWTYKTDIPHETFKIMGDGEVYCRGIVFALADVTVKP